MPSRMIDYAALWSSDKPAACAEWAQAEYAWLYGLADANGSFELTNLRVIWCRVAAIRKNLSIEGLEQVFGEFREKGLLFIWDKDGKRYGHWTGSDRAGRLPPKSLRKRFARLAPPVPQEALRKYLASFVQNGCAPHLDSLKTDSRPDLVRIGVGLEGDKDKASCSSPSAPQGGFDTFWKVYPRKQDKARAARAWRKLKPEEHPAVLAGIERARSSEQWQRDGGRYVPLPSTFLNGRRWEDELPTNGNPVPQPPPNIPTVRDIRPKER